MLRLTIPMNGIVSIEDKFEELIRSTLEIEHLIEPVQTDIIPKEFRFPGEWPQSINTFCWFCDRKINMPKFIPTFMRIDQNEDIICVVMGRRDELFCTFSCASAAIGQIYNDDTKKWRAHNLLLKEYQMMTGDWTQSIKPAPPKIKRKRYNGDWTEEEYYETLSCVDPELLKKKAQSMGLYQPKFTNPLHAFDEGFKAWSMNDMNNTDSLPNSQIRKVKVEQKIVHETVEKSETHSKHWKKQPKATTQPSQPSTIRQRASKEQTTQEISFDDIERDIFDTSFDTTGDMTFDTTGDMVFDTTGDMTFDTTVDVAFATSDDKLFDISFDVPKTASNDIKTTHQDSSEDSPDDLFSERDQRVDNVEILEDFARVEKANTDNVNNIVKIFDDKFKSMIEELGEI